MPLVRIEILKGKDLVYKKTLLDAVHTALIKAIQIEDEDRFQRLYEVEEDLFEKKREQNGPIHPHRDYHVSGPHKRAESKDL